MRALCALLIMSGVGVQLPPPPPMPRPDAPPDDERGLPKEFIERRGELGVLPIQDRSLLIDVSRYRGKAPHRRALQVPAELNARVKADPLRATPELVAQLTRGISDPFERLRVLHDWVALNLRYDWKSFLTDKIPRQDAASVLRRGVAVCDGYASVMNALCRYAKLECVKVVGYARGVNSSPFEVRGPQSNHAWNAAKLGGAWYLLDATWDSRPFETSYFLLDPESFVYQHYPDDPEWQLLEPPRTKDEFERSPWPSGSYLGLTGAAPHGVEYFNALDGELEFFQPHPPGIAFYGTVGLIGADAGAGSDRWIAFRPGDGGTYVSVAAPDAGSFEVNVLAVRGKERGLLTAFIRADAGTGHGYVSLPYGFPWITGPVGVNARVEKEVRLDVPHRRGIIVMAGLDKGDPRRFADPWVRVLPGLEHTTLYFRFPQVGPQTVDFTVARWGFAHTPLRFEVAAAATEGFLGIPTYLTELTGEPAEGMLLGNHFGRELALHFETRAGVEIRGTFEPLDRPKQRRPLSVEVSDAGIAVTATFPSPGRYTVSLEARKRGGAWRGWNPLLVISEEPRP